MSRVLNARQFRAASYPDGRVPMEDTPLGKYMSDEPMGATRISKEYGHGAVSAMWDGMENARVRPVRIGPGFVVGGKQKALHAPALEHYLKGGEAIHGDTPMVVRYPNGRQELMEGHHRFAAKLMKGEDEVPSRVYDVGRRRWL